MFHEKNIVIQCIILIFIKKQCFTIVAHCKIWYTDFVVLIEAHKYCDKLLYWEKSHVYYYINRKYAF